MEYVLNRPDVRPVWKRFTEHDFVEGLGSGTLPLERFKDYLVQDYLYLVRITKALILFLITKRPRHISLGATHWLRTRDRIWNLLPR